LLTKTSLRLFYLILQKTTLKDVILDKKKLQKKNVTKKKLQKKNLFYGETDGQLKTIVRNLTKNVI